MMGLEKRYYCNVCRDSFVNPHDHDQYTTVNPLSLGVPEKPDMVNLPKHYADFKVEPYHFIGENDLGFLEGCIIKYICRYKGKNGVEDVKKAERMCRMLVKKLSGDPDWWKREKVTYSVVE